MPASFEHSVNRATLRNMLHAFNQRGRILKIFWGASQRHVTSKLETILTKRKYC